MIVLDGQEREVKYGVMAARAIERELGKPINLVLAEFGANQVSINAITTIVWAGLLHERKRLTPELVAMWLEADSVDFPQVTSVCMKELNASMVRLLRLESTQEEEKEESKN